MAEHRTQIKIVGEI